MKILVLVMSCDIKEYPKLIAKQKETWDSIHHPHVHTIYYYSSHTTKLVKQRLNIDIEEGHGYFYIKTMLAFEKLLELDWTYLFKTDNSAYVNKEVLYETMGPRPKKNYYGGHLYQTTYTGTDPFLWGEGIMLSRDIVEYLVSEYRKSKIIRSGVEDVHIGMILKEKEWFGKDHFKWDTSLTIPSFYPYKEVIKSHVYRCKNDEDKDNVQDQLLAMQTIHNYIINGKTDHSIITQKET